MPFVRPRGMKDSFVRTATERQCLAVSVGNTLIRSLLPPTSGERAPDSPRRFVVSTASGRRICQFSVSQAALRFPRLCVSRPMVGHFMLQSRRSLVRSFGRPRNVANEMPETLFSPSSRCVRCRCSRFALCVSRASRVKQ